MAVLLHGDNGGHDYSFWSASWPIRQCVFIITMLVCLAVASIMSISDHHHNDGSSRESPLVSLDSLTDGTIGQLTQGSNNNDDDASENYQYHNENDNAAILANIQDDDTLEPGTSDYDNVLNKSVSSEGSYSKNREPSPKIALNDDDNIEQAESEDDFCQDDYVDSAYFNGYDTILTRGDRLWYYYKDQHRISKAYDQRRFTQGER